MYVMLNYFIVPSGITRKQYCEAVQNKTDTDWLCVNCDHPTCHFQADLFEFNPSVDSTHLTAEPTTDSFTTEPADSFTAEPIADTFTAEPTANSLPSFYTTNSSHSDMEIDHATLMSFELPEYTQEASIDDSLPLRGAATEPTPVEYITISESTEHNYKNLCDSLGYSYVYNYTTSRGIVKWRCAICNSNIKCNAKVNQDGNKFTRCSNPHVCTPKPGVSTTLQIHKEINKAAYQDVHASAAEITERVLAERAPMSQHHFQLLSSLPRMQTVDANACGHKICKI